MKQTLANLTVAALSGALTAFLFIIIMHPPNQIFDDIKATDVFLTIFTFALFLCAVWQADLTRMVANAAMKSATVAERALTDLERPWLFIESIRVNRNGFGPEDPNFWDISFEGRNVGRSPALIKNIEIKVQDKDRLPITPDYTNSAPISSEKTVAANNTFSTQAIGPGGPKVKNGQPIQYIVYGRIIYSELNGKLHHTGFAVAVSPHIPVASSYQNDAYEYYD